MACWGKCEQAYHVAERNALAAKNSAVRKAAQALVDNDGWQPKEQILRKALAEVLKDTR